MYKALKDTAGHAFSCNIYEEMNIENLKKEYEKAQLELYNYKFEENDPPLYESEIEYRQAYKKAMVLRLDSMKKVFRKYIKEKNLEIR